MLRIEVYPENDENKFFSIKVGQDSELIREEACYFDEKGSLQVTHVEDADYKIRKSYKMTHAQRNIRGDEMLHERVRDTYFDHSFWD